VMVKLRDLLGDTTPDIRGTMANLNKTTGTLKDKLPPAMDKADALLAKLNTTLDNAQGALKDLTATLQNAKEITGSLRSVVVQNRTRFDDMIRSAKAASDNLKFATEEIRRSPWRLLYKPAPNEMGNLNLYDAARQFAEGANDLNDTAGALRDLINNNPNADPAEVKRLMDKVDQSFSNFQQVEQKLWTNVKE